MGAGLFSILGMIFSAQTQARSTVIEFFSKLRLHEIHGNKHNSFASAQIPPGMWVALLWHYCDNYRIWPGCCTTNEET